MKDMQTWLKCIKLFAVKNRSHRSVFLGLPYGVYEYKQSDPEYSSSFLYKDCLFYWMHYSYRDGFEVLIRKTNPYHTIFHYLDDGACYISESDPEQIYQQLQQEISQLRKQTNTLSGKKIFECLESVVCRFHMLHQSEE